MVDDVRKWRAQKQNIYIKDNLQDGKYLVSGSRSKDYQINLNEPSCTCPDWQKRQPEGGCKHILHVKIKKGLINPVPSAKTNFGNPKYRSKSNYPSNWANLSNRTKKRDNWTCQKCGDQGGPHGNARLEAHHMKPKSRGGKDELNNLITVCNSCHEDEHGHAIPNDVNLNEDYIKTGPENPIDSNFSGSESINERSKRNRRSKKNSAESKLISSANYTPRNEQNPRPSTSSSNPSTRDPREDEVRIKSSTSLQDMPKMMETEITLINFVKIPLVISILLFVIFALTVTIFSVGIFAWAGIIILSFIIYLYLQIKSIFILVRLESMKDINNQLKSLLNKLDESRRESVQKRRISRINFLLKESNKLSRKINNHLREEYIDWITQSQERLNYPWSVTCSELFVTDSSEKSEKERPSDPVTDHQMFKQIVSTLTEFGGSATTSQIAKEMDISHVGAYDRLRTLEVEGDVALVNDNKKQKWKVMR